MISKRGPLRIAVVRWFANEGMAEAVAGELRRLGHAAVYFDWNAALPAEVDLVFSQGPFGRFSRVAAQVAALPPERRPYLIQWNYEGMPDPRLPWPLARGLAAARAYTGRLPDDPRPIVRALAQRPLLRWLNQRLIRLSYMGDYFHAHRRGVLTRLFDISVLHARRYSRHGLPALAVPWGSVPGWHAHLDLARDIDVLWMGARATRRRSRLLDRVQRELAARGIRMHVADNQANPFIFGARRTRMLNRAAITLNLTRTWYDDNFVRFPIVMPNRSLIVSEPMQPHAPDYVPGEHYVSAPIEQLADTIEYYLRHPDERRRIVENAYALVTTRLTLRNSAARILAALREPAPAAVPAA